MVITCYVIRIVTFIKVTINLKVTLYRTCCDLQYKSWWVGDLFKLSRFDDINKESRLIIGGWNSVIVKFSLEHDFLRRIRMIFFLNTKLILSVSCRIYGNKIYKWEKKIKDVLRSRKKKMFTSHTVFRIYFSQASELECLQSRNFFFILLLQWFFPLFSQQIH